MNLVNILKDEDVDDARLHVNILNPGWEIWHPTAAGLKSTLCSCWVKRSNSTDVKIKMLSAGKAVKQSLMFWCFYWSLTRDNDFILAEKVTLLSQTQKQEGAPSPGVKPGQTTRPEREERSGVSRWIIKCQFPFFLFLSCELLLLINCWSGHKDNYALIVFRSDKQKNKSEGQGNNRNRKRDFHLTVQRVDDIQPHVWTHFCPGAI